MVKHTTVNKDVLTIYVLCVEHKVYKLRSLFRFSHATFDRTGAGKAGYDTRHELFNGLGHRSPDQARTDADYTRTFFTHAVNIGHGIPSGKALGNTVRLGAVYLAAARINKARQNGGRIVCVGTTSVRTLEGVAQVCGRAQPFAGWTDIFLYPGRPFRVVDGIITNFHLPESSLLMLVSAFAGRKRILEAYQEAVKEGYRFFSYGDAMLIR